MAASNNGDGDEEQYETIQSVPVNDELIQAAREAGASEFLIRVLEVEPEDAGVERNSVRSEIQKYCYWADEVSANVIEGKHHYGGGFFQAVWNGQRGHARSRADSSNQKILDELAVPA